MEKFNNISNSRYDCKYHIVFVTKFRKKSSFGKIIRYLKGVFHELIVKALGIKDIRYNRLKFRGVGVYN